MNRKFVTSFCIGLAILFGVSACAKKKHAVVGPFPIPTPQGAATSTPTAIPTATPTPNPTVTPNPLVVSCPGADLGTLTVFPVVVTGNTSGAPNSTDTACALGGVPDHVYMFTLPAPTTLTITTCSPMTNYDTTLGLGSACGISDILCNDDDFTCPSSIFFSKMSPGLVAAGTYWITVDGYEGGDVGTYELTISSP